jgi:hypothetical protein
VTPFGKSIAERHEQAVIMGGAVVSHAAADHIAGARTIETDEDKRIERARSAHQVGFGSIIPKGAERPDAGLVSVALKPFHHPEGAIREVRGYLTLQQLGVETFDPIGIFPAEHGDHHVMVSKKRNDLTSLDRDTWVVGRQVTSHESMTTVEGNNATVKAIARLLAHIHVHGVFAPDGQIKNFAKTPDGKVGLIDPENLFVCQEDPLDFGAHAWEDINKLVKSLVYYNSAETDGEEAKIFGVGMLYGLPLREVRNSIEELIVSPYLEFLLDYEAQSVEEEERKQSLFDTLMSQFDHSEWPQHMIEASRRWHN